MKNLKLHLMLTFLFLYLIFSAIAGAAQKEPAKLDEFKLSPQTQACIGCHETYTPGIVHDWLSSRHSKVTPLDAMKKPLLQRRISVENNPPSPPFSKGG